MRILPILLISISGYIPADGGYQPYQTDRQTGPMVHGPSLPGPIFLSMCDGRDLAWAASKARQGKGREGMLQVRFLDAIES
ncbi:hypothetical protein M758_9G011000 [Ceratodon purpureus]|nr:hypothetical protein M758_9G011000 [Ceratodon purpureus]